ncbi:hypothetical protein CFC21_029977 [Triticum aestivum]|uniref:Cytochrome b-c1 complex subunit Rieske, mitochondrial n=3 Tax=Triticum TaxID=4564 RepID=A0A341Q6B8_WHEAT|nr:hypothetical protein CFC21_017247 [Triticum aestivum]KAF7016343.1 hypothetical protein CFC21_029977 [Triticum aestivum]VAH32010.1 unnamed protein product [Triticum turgidum subsp. durum]
MLRVAGRRLSSSLSWRPVATVGARGPLAGAGGPGRDDDDGSAYQRRFAIESPFFTAARGFSSAETLVPRNQDAGLAELPATVAALKNPNSKILYDQYNHERYPPGDPSKRAFAYFVLSGGRFVYASLLRLLVLKFVLSMSAIFIRRRTDDDIKLANSVDVASLRHPEQDAERVKNPEWLVVIGVCTHLGCIPLPNSGDFGGWFCPCHGSHYDISGRIRKGPAPYNLEVPTYSFLEDNKMLIG